MAETADVVIIGGAVIGSAVAYALSVNPDFQGRVIVLEKDRSYERAASSLSTSGIRQQFSSAVNVKLSQYTVEFLKQADVHLGTDGSSSGIVFHENGYLLLGGPDAVGAFEDNNRLQRSLGVDVRLLGRSELGRRFPWLTLDDIEVGSFTGPGEGWIDGYVLMGAFKRRARANGVEYRYVEATGIVRDGDRITGARCSGGVEIAAAHVVNASGFNGRAIAGMAGVDLPLRNVKQVVFAFASPHRAQGMPFVFTPDRLFFRPESDDYIAGLGIKTLEQLSDFDVDYAVFEDEVWPRLAHRVAGFENARLRSAWAGHYDMSLLDHNAFIGAVPGLHGFYLANGFSGHGLMHSPGIGRALSELIIYGGYRTLDLSELSVRRIAANAPMRESIQY
ncbi:NAD(P)/FAD-dependent oxidoreductase [Rhodopila sp.]|uniref:NAD(P)/FAD-dependent oxidoreductase n=1 Tax=Rhodopila sp. TaxID=2480087 RepID=UPI003D096407